ncbi:alpha/beta hydrolase [Nostocoides jenkinsii]|uniref:Putative Secreted protein n=1 Tax=Nostocoides jenkinsii Ben 74 TaxID=1193518 RepID=A0A077MBR0_9MICO|nr:alpha/beta hydrolase [Tetrasphaera jenkinsii]CCI52297.1 putative Secreted protein [Tetrasphaera jenkinsii Ben 74]
MIGRVALCAGVAAAAAARVGWAIARRLTAPVGPRTFDLAVREIEHADDGNLIVLDRTEQTSAHGIYNLWFEHGGWTQLSTEIVDRGPAHVGRRITGTAPGFAPKTGNCASWSGIYYVNSADAGLEARDITITTPAGQCPAWRINGDPSTWAIHIHGLGSTRAGTLRGVRAATELGYTSLVVSYRNTTEGPRVGTGRSTLGHTETADVDEAIGYAVRRGAQQIVLFGWSMGATIALQLADHPRHHGLVAALVLDSPVLNWTEVIKTNCVRSGLPAAAGHLAIPWLTLAPLARAVGLPGRIPLRYSNWTARTADLATPTLILHGTRDDSVPIRLSQALRDARPGFVELETFDADHTLCWNTDPDRWHETVISWLKAIDAGGAAD